jgi:hypothetical protein
MNRPARSPAAARAPEKVSCRSEHDSEQGGKTAMGNQSARVPNLKRVAAGRRNQKLSRGLSAAGRERLRATALANRPWEHSTGPRTAAGKAAAARNGKVRQLGPRSVREIRAELADLGALVQAMRDARQATTQGA